MDPRSFDALARSLAAPKTRRGFLGGIVALVAGVRAAGAQVSQIQCGNQACASNPGGCKPGCICCVYTNPITGTVINSRCRPPGTCSPGTQVTTTTTTPPPAGSCLTDAHCPSQNPSCVNGRCRALTCPPPPALQFCTSSITSCGNDAFGPCRCARDLNDVGFCTDHIFCSTCIDDSACDFLGPGAACIVAGGICPCPSGKACARACADQAQTTTTTTTTSATTTTQAPTSTTTTTAAPTTTTTTTTEPTTTTQAPTTTTTSTTTTTTGPTTTTPPPVGGCLTDTDCPSPNPTCVDGWCRSLTCPPAPAPHFCGVNAPLCGAEFCNCARDLNGVGFCTDFVVCSNCSDDAGCEVHQEVVGPGAACIDATGCPCPSGRGCARKCPN